MTALMPGTKAPDVLLKTTDGNMMNLSKTLQQEPVAVLAFFKVSCPVCQFMFPYLERLHRAYPQIPIWGVSQDDFDSSKSFSRSYGVSFPILLDEDLGLTVQYGLTHVPSVFLLNKNAEVALTMEGFVKEDLEVINRRLAEFSALPLKALFTSSDDVPELRPG